MAGDTGLKRATARVSASLILSALVAIAISTAFLQPTATSAQQGGVKIAALKCDTAPEIVQLTNGGTTGADLSGWKLVSDPAGTETFALTPVATLAAGASVFVESGPAATGAFKWSASQVFRDGDASDYARLVDNAGATVQQVACTASPNVVPNGGGPPGDSSALAIGTVAAAAGGVLLTAAALFGLVWMGAGTLLKRRRNPPAVDAVAATEEARHSPEPAVEVAEAPVEPSRPRGQAAKPDPALWPYLVVVLAALAAVLLLFMADSGKSRKK